MNKKYRITSTFRFTTFMVIFILCILTAATTVTGYNTANSSSMKVYRQVQVSSGDTLWAIAEEYGPDHEDIRQTVYEICQLNDISADQLQADMKIIVPVYE